MKRVAIIPARGGSRRLPRKNILPVLGRPALFYPVQAARDAGIFDRVIVSTEDRQIRQAALDSGAQVMDRPERLAAGTVGVAQVCQDVLETLNEAGDLPGQFCCIYATALFITPEDLVASFQMLEASGSVVMGVSPYNLYPLQAMEAGDNGCLTPKWPEYVTAQGQNHPSLVASNGTFYWAKTTTFLTHQTFYTDSIKGYHIPWIRAIDMDTSEDYEIVQRLAPLFIGTEK